MPSRSTSASLVGLLVLSACVGPPARQPPPPPARPTHAPPVAVRPLPDAEPAGPPLTPGTWSYADSNASSEARYADAGQAPVVVMRCDRRGGAVVLLVRAATVSVTMSLRATTLSRTVATDAEGPYRRTRFTPRDPMLDALAFSRGRFVIVIGTEQWVLPTWPELTRVIEDCRQIENNDD